MSHVVLLEREADVYVAAEQAASVAEEAGFDRYARADIETAVSEICSNVVRHAEGGWLAIRLRAGGFEVAATDRGPGFGAPPRGRAGLGIGLEGARRLMGSLEVESIPGGSRVTATRPLPSHPPSPSWGPWAVSVVYRARAGEAVSGDAARVETVGDELRIGLADGLGSGVHAARTARAVLAGMELPHARGPAAALEAAHRASGHTRGAAAAVVFLQPDGQGVFSGLGDVSGIAAGSGELRARPGMVGHGRPDPVDVPFRVEAGGSVLLWSDGIHRPLLRGRADSRGFSLHHEDVEMAVLELGSPRQDGTLLAVRPGA
ncbi:MAG: ATP-binding protein [Actinomycetota bacterium]